MIDSWVTEEKSLVAGGDRRDGVEMDEDVFYASH